MKFLTVCLLAAFVGVSVAKIVRHKRDNSYGDEPVTPSGAVEVHETATETAEGSGASVEGSGSSSGGSSPGSSSPGGSSAGSKSGYAAEGETSDSPKEHAPVAVEQSTQKAPSQQPSGYRK